MIRKSARWYMLILLPVFIILALAVPVLAAYNYVIPIQVANNSTTSYADGIPILVPLDNDQLVTEDFIAATGLDIDVQESSSIPFSVSSDYLGIFTDSLAASQTKNFSDYLGFTPNATSYPIITGVGGSVDTPDDATLEIGNNFAVEFDGYITVPSAGYDTIVHKPGAFATSIDSAGTLSAGIVDTEIWDVAAEQVAATTLSTTDAKTLVRLDDNSFVAIYSDAANLYAKAGTVSGTTITWGALSAANVTETQYLTNSCCAIDTDTFVVARRYAGDFDGYVTVGTVDPVTLAITWDDTDEFLNSDVIYVSACKLDTDKWLMAYQDTAGTEVEIMVGTWDGVAITLGAAVVVDTDSPGGFTALAQLETDKAILFYEGTGVEGYVISVAGTVPSVGAMKQISTDNASSVFRAVSIDSTSALVMWDSTNEARTEIVTISGTTISDSTEYLIMPTTVGYIAKPCLVNNILVYGTNNADADAEEETYRAVISGTTITVIDNTSSAKLSDPVGADTLSSCGYIPLDASTSKIMGIYCTTADSDPYVRIGYANYVSYSLSVSVAGVTSGEYDIEVTADTVDLKLYVDTVEEDSVALAGGSVADNSNDWWIGLFGNAPYTNMLTIEVGAVQQLWYQPATIITSDTAVDRSGTGNHGDITWGANPAGIEITVSAAISATDYTAGTDGATIPDPLPIPSSFNQTATNTTGITSLWLYDLVNRAADHLGFSAQTMYVIIGLITATGVGFGALIGTGNMLGFAIGFGATGGLFAASGVMPWWAITITVAIVAMGIYTWRRG